MSKKEWTQVGTIRMSEAKDDGTPGKLYIKLHPLKGKDGKYSASNLRKLANALEEAENGVSLQIEKPQDKIRKLASLGYIDEDDLESRLDAVPDYIKYEITLPPQD